MIDNNAQKPRNKVLYELDKTLFELTNDLEFPARDIAPIVESNVSLTNRFAAIREECAFANEIIGAQHVPHLPEGYIQNMDRGMYCDLISFHIESEIKSIFRSLFFNTRFAYGHNPPNAQRI